MKYDLVEKEINLSTELNSEALQFIIDIARPTLTPEEIVEKVNSNVIITIKGN